MAVQDNKAFAAGLMFHAKPSKQSAQALKSAMARHFQNARPKPVRDPAVVSRRKKNMQVMAAAPSGSRLGGMGNLYGV